MIPGERQRLINGVEEDLRATVKQARELLERAEALGQILTGYYTLYPDLRPAPNQWEETLEEAAAIAEGATRFREGQQLRGQAAVSSVLMDAAEDDDSSLTVAEVVEALAIRGWLPRSKNPEAPVRTALERLFKNGDVEKGVRASNGLVCYRWVDRDEDADSEGYEPDAADMERMRAEEEEQEEV